MLTREIRDVRDAVSQMWRSERGAHETEKFYNHLNI